VNRHGPQLADGERRGALVGEDEALERLGVKAAVGVADDFEREGVDARVTFEGPGREFREFVVVAARQVFADLAELLLDDVEVVEEPLGGGRDRAVLADGVGQRAVGLDQHAAVLLGARQQLPTPAGGGRDVVI
jgi:hypothetical protein